MSRLAGRPSPPASVLQFRIRGPFLPGLSKLPPPPPLPPLPPLSLIIFCRRPSRSPLVSRMPQRAPHLSRVRPAGPVRRDVTQAMRHQASATAGQQPNDAQARPEIPYDKSLTSSFGTLSCLFTVQSDSRKLCFILILN